MCFVGDCTVYHVIFDQWVVFLNIFLSFVCCIQLGVYALYLVIVNF